MNIFYLDIDPHRAATMLCNTHLRKMLTEAAQMLSTAVAYHDPELHGRLRLMKVAYFNHPCTRWARESYTNWSWLFEHARAMYYEYLGRTGVAHASWFRLLPLLSANFTFADLGLTPVALAMPDQYKTNDPVESYRAYYAGEKAPQEWFYYTNCQPIGWLNFIAMPKKQSTTQTEAPKVAPKTKKSVAVPTPEETPAFLDLSQSFPVWRFEDKPANITKDWLRDLTSYLNSGWDNIAVLFNSIDHPEKAFAINHTDQSREIFQTMTKTALSIHCPGSKETDWSASLPTEHGFSYQEVCAEDESWYIVRIMCGEGSSVNFCCYSNDQTEFATTEFLSGVVFGAVPNVREKVEPTSAGKTVAAYNPPVASGKHTEEPIAAQIAGIEGALRSLGYGYVHAAQVGEVICIIVKN